MRFISARSALGRGSGGGLALHWVSIEYCYLLVHETLIVGPTIEQRRQPRVIPHEWRRLVASHDHVLERLRLRKHKPRCHTMVTQRYKHCAACMHTCRSNPTNVLKSMSCMPCMSSVYDFTSKFNLLVLMAPPILMRAMSCAIAASNSDLKPPKYLCVPDLEWFPHGTHKCALNTW